MEAKESKQVRHTPEPWVLGGCSGRMITTPSGYVGDGFIADVDTLANAQFIVTACNSHDELLAACKELLAIVEEANPYWHGRPDRADERARAAILKAEPTQQPSSV